MEKFNHIPVLAKESLHLLKLSPGDLVVDCTCGGGGHSKLFLNEIKESGKLIALDQDIKAINHLKSFFSKELESTQVELYHQPFNKLKELTSIQKNRGKIAVIFADIGMSSPQIDSVTRGFSFRYDAPLDMRMDRVNNPQTAAKLLNTASQEELCEIFFKLGEEPKARQIAKLICLERKKKKIQTTKELVAIIEKALPYAKKSKKHPATKVFQALRIYVNKELEQLETLLSDSLKLLKPGGRLAIITFHSLEDKIVKNFFRLNSGKASSDDWSKKLPWKIQTEVDTIKGSIIKPFPCLPSEDEIQKNSRARSAKLRVFQKL